MGRDTVCLESSQRITEIGKIERKKRKIFKNRIKKRLTNKKERYIIIERFITGKTQMELAEEIGISQAQISRLEKNALNNIKNNIN